LRKANTLAKWEKVRRVYITLRKENPDESDRWIAEKIEEMDIADGAAVETIRKNMKTKK
jgi:hypothetical protein